MAEQTIMTVSEIHALNHDFLTRSLIGWSNGDGSDEHCEQLMEDAEKADRNTSEGEQLFQDWLDAEEDWVKEHSDDQYILRWPSHCIMKNVTEASFSPVE